VQIARENAARAGVHIDVRHGNASELPLPDDSFDAVVCVAAFKNFADPVGAINEMHRVLKPGGVASIFDLRKDASPEEIAAEVRNMHLSPLNARITRWTFQLMLIKRAYAPDVLAQMAADSRFSGGDLLPSGIGCEVRLVKRSLAPLRARLQDHAGA
jgi:ubiquinone/menaquinone biosynthesis C-methylase UbiE